MALPILSGNSAANVRPVGIDVSPARHLWRWCLASVPTSLRDGKGLDVWFVSLSLSFPADVRACSHRLCYYMCAAALPPSVREGPGSGLRAVEMQCVVYLCTNSRV